MGDGDPGGDGYYPGGGDEVLCVGFPEKMGIYRAAGAAGGGAFVPGGGFWTIP